VKEASGNMTQMCDVCNAVPDSFLVLSGDDALTLPLMAIGGRGIVSVASNAVPSEMSRLVELAEANDFPAARKLHRQLFPFLQVNFIESNPIPIKSAMASLGLLEEVYRLPMVPPSAASKERIAAVLQALTRDAHAAAR
jgi:4-hydroxy-tetrahydrodipicolinate synthase